MRAESCSPVSVLTVTVFESSSVGGEWWVGEWVVGACNSRVG